jgi:hypothetical protein
MNALKTRNKLIDEISRIPDERLPDIYNLIHYFRLGLNVKEKNPAKILKLAGSWKDMPEEDFDDFLEEIRTRRKNAFLSRRNRETSID